MLTFFVWSNFVLPTKAADGKGWDGENWILVAILLVTGLYFLIMEFL